MYAPSVQSLPGVALLDRSRTIFVDMAGLRALRTDDSSADDELFVGRVEVRLVDGVAIPRPGLVVYGSTIGSGAAHLCFRTHLMYTSFSLPSF